MPHLCPKPFYSIAKDQSDPNYHKEKIKAALEMALIDRPNIETFQEMNDIIQKDTDQLISYFIENPDNTSLIEKKNPLCIEAMRDYLYRLFREVHKQCGHDINVFI